MSSILQQQSPEIVPADLEAGNSHQVVHDLTQRIRRVLCEFCGKRIPAARVEAIQEKTTKTCVACQEEDDRYRDPRKHPVKADFSRSEDPVPDIDKDPADLMRDIIRG